MPFWPFFGVAAFMNFVALLIVSIVGDMGADGSEKFWGSLIGSLVLDFVLAVSWLVAKGLLS